MLTNPLRDRFGIVSRLEFYTPEELAQIVERSARLLNVKTAPEGAWEIATRSRGTPRIANRLLRRVRDYAEVKALRQAAEGRCVVTREIADQALRMLDVDVMGFDVMDRKLLLAVLEKFNGGPVGLDNLAAAIGEERDTIEDVLEPYLIQQGYLQRTPRGRTATLSAYRHFGIAAPAAARHRRSVGCARRLVRPGASHASDAPGGAVAGCVQPGRACLLSGHGCRRCRVPRPLSEFLRARAHRVVASSWASSRASWSSATACCSSCAKLHMSYLRPARARRSADGHRRRSSIWGARSSRSEQRVLRGERGAGRAARSIWLASLPAASSPTARAARVCVPRWRPAWAGRVDSRGGCVNVTARPVAAHADHATPACW